MTAMLALSLEYGIVTDSWYAELAFRRRVSMSAIGSVIVMGLLPFLDGVSPSGDLRRSGYQLLLVTPGSSPRCAISRTQMRQSPNLRYTATGRPQRRVAQSRAQRCGGGRRCGTRRADARSGVYREFGLCRICVREMAHRGELP